MVGLALAGAFFTALIAPASAYDPDAMDAFASQLFQKIDLDQDGVITRQEYDATEGGGFYVDFAKLDLDGDGTVTLTEYRTVVQIFHSAPKGTEI